MKVLLFGCNGQVGSSVRAALAGAFDVVALGRGEADFGRQGAVAQLVEDHEADVVINAVAFTAVDAAESDAATAHRINADAVAELARAARRRWLIHYSTDYVFDGAKTTPYVEEDATAPLNVYGRTKRDGEQAVATAGGRHIVLRTSWVHAPRHRNFATTILANAGKRDSLRVVADQVGAPTSAADIAWITSQIVERIAQGTPPADGVYHCASAGAANWFEYARFVVAEAMAEGFDVRCRPENVVPVASADYPQAATRPKNSRLGVTKLEAELGIEMPDWRPGVRHTIRSSLHHEPSR